MVPFMTYQDAQQHELSRRCTLEIAAAFILLALPVATQLLADDHLQVTLPEQAALVDGKPTGEGWTNLFANGLDDWQYDPKYWSFDDGVLQGKAESKVPHLHAVTKSADHQDFALHVLVKSTTRPKAKFSSGILLRKQRSGKSLRIDIGPSVWGNIHLQKNFPKDLQAKIVKPNDYNHYYIELQGNHLKAWLNGIKTIDQVIDANSKKPKLVSEPGSIGFIIGHSSQFTQIEVKLLAIRQLVATRAQADDT